MSLAWQDNMLIRITQTLASDSKVTSCWVRHSRPHSVNDHRYPLVCPLYDLWPPSFLASGHDSTEKPRIVYSVRIARFSSEMTHTPPCFSLPLRLDEGKTKHIVTPIPGKTLPFCSQQPVITPITYDSIDFVGNAWGEIMTICISETNCYMYCSPWGYICSTEGCHEHTIACGMSQIQTSEHWVP